MKIDDKERLAYFIDTYQNLVYSICFKITGNHYDAQDMAQETFLSAYRNFSNFNGENEKAWICRIATNKCLDLKKKAASRQIPTEDEFFAEIKDTGLTTEETFLEGEARNRLKENCEKLKPPYNEIARLYFYEEMSVAQIADKLGRNEKTVQTQMYRAKAQLKKCYEKQTQV